MNFRLDEDCRNCVYGHNIEPLGPLGVNNIAQSAPLDSL